ncbi:MULTISPECIES: helix-turn-helix domain-containing protein [Methylomicrobium]|uniref:Putative transcriptional regulator n=1 Tax=Methylomicrobium album BG8 TaxID=686340 RepID=H8GLP8_METAL|nr:MULTISPECIES: helix-turn-helix transcriptional regulator [Methylomicrobium]EIC30575.1 putative transcriptional regulator [Methylomicrobium album BG8]
MVDKNEVAIVKLVGGRMREARELCKLTVYEAADRLGIPKPLLEKLEVGFDVPSLPLKWVRQASRVYDVSLDYLFGYSDDWEVAEETKQGREIGAWIHQQQSNLFSRWAVRQLQLERQVEAMTKAVGVLPDEIEAIVEALNTFRGMNPDFDKLPAGSMLQHRIKRANEKAQAARRALIRHPVPACK